VGGGKLIAVEAKNDLWTNCSRNCKRSKRSHPLTLPPTVPSLSNTPLAISF